MANFLRRAWRYMNASANAKLDAKADPKVQIEQAIQDAQRQHQLLTQQAASVLGNRRQLEMKLSRQLEEIAKLQASTRQALVLSDQARASGDDVKAAQYEQTAQTFATQLVSAEGSVEDLKQLHQQAVSSAEAAKRAVAQNEHNLRQALAERSKLLTQLEHAKMQEQMNTALSQMSELAPPGDTPSLGEVRAKIEQRYATALGQRELAADSVEARMLEVQKATTDQAALSRLDEIRAGLSAGTGSAGAGGQQSLAKGSQPAALENPAGPGTNGTSSATSTADHTTGTG